MPRLRIFFACFLLAIAIPLWRWLDLVAFTWPANSIFALGISFIVLSFIVLPIWLLKPKTHWAWLALLPLIVFASYSTGPLSKMSTADPQHAHCGPMTFTGLLYPLRTISTAALLDDLEARNQLCWARKMILRVPLTLTSAHELEVYKGLVEKRLMLPEQKFKSTLPMVAALDLYLMYRFDSQGLSLQHFRNGKNFIDALHFWEQQYTVEISARDYGWWDWPFSALIKFEYGLIETHWRDIIENIRVEF
jgi:hypothetical protein